MRACVYDRRMGVVAESVRETVQYGVDLRRGTLECEDSVISSVEECSTLWQLMAYCVGSCH